MPEALYRASQSVVEEDLSSMVLARDELPYELRELYPSRDGLLDNETMAEQGLPGTTTADISNAGRITGYIREFVTSARPGAIQAGSDVAVATLSHLFNNNLEVSLWMTEKFLGDSQRAVGKDLGQGQKLVSVDRLQFDGFSDETVGIRTLQTTPAGLVSSTVVDFRIGRLLGVAYLVSLGDVERQQLVQQLGLELERKMVKVLLDAF